MTIQLPEHFMIHEGHLYDTRSPNWGREGPLRENYAVVNSKVNNTRDLRAFIRNPTAWPGGYGLFAITDDGGTLCADCCRKHYREISDAIRNDVNIGWKVTAIDIDAECNYDSNIMCDQCGTILVEGERYE